MKYLAVILSILAVLLPSSAATFPKEQQVHYVNANLFLQNNTDKDDALAAYAEAICIQDKVTDNSPEAWLVASAKCADSYRDDRMLESSNDGQWKEYSMTAYGEIKAICVGRVEEICMWFR